MKNTNKYRIIPFEFHILVGLPGSGKTYWAEHNFQKPPYECHHTGNFIVSLDDHKFEKNWIYKALDEELKNYMDYCHQDKITVCIDGPIMTYNNLYQVIGEIIEYLKVNCKWKQFGAGDYSLSFIIHQWDENRNYCLYNDERRGRTIKAMRTIRFEKYDDIDIKIVKQYLNAIYITTIDKVKKIGHMVKKTTTYEQVFEPACDNIWGHGDNEKGRYLYSKNWTLGGECGNCWGDITTVNAEPAKEFTELDDFLLKVAPNISFLQYKKLFNACVEQIDWHNHDYYSSGTTEACWRCDMKKLYNMLKEMNYIED